MQLNLLSKTAKRVTKLTDKARAAIEEKLDGASTKKRKNHTSGDSTAAIKFKKAKATQPDGSGDRPSSEDITPPPQLAPVPVVHRAIVRTEEEEAALYDDVNDDNDAERRSSSPDVESVADELSMSTLVQENILINKNIEWLMKEWTSPVYAFFDPMPCIIENDGRRAHEFKCSA
ncbi:hypothetical protein EV702DRAFT_1043301 [Suillus placidus]|uniref:Uncharacterized protein n=1 Tax=Suillus placidus TaxID=48579 RepID=A0A9P7A191_9AGAM|nr:hypothetical protein EV702DRAFT_1043301 [Suillus placidus]